MTTTTTPDLDGMQARAKSTLARSLMGTQEHYDALDKLNLIANVRQLTAERDRFQVAACERDNEVGAAIARAEKAEDALAAALGESTMANLENEAALVAERSRAESAESDRDQWRQRCEDAEQQLRDCTDAHNANVGRAESAEAKVLRLREALTVARAHLNRDKTGFGSALARIRKEVEGRKWIADSRGPYEWDDDRYKAEAGEALRVVDVIAYNALSHSGDIANEGVRAIDAALALDSADGRKA